MPGISDRALHLRHTVKHPADGRVLSFFLDVHVGSPFEEAAGIGTDIEFALTVTDPDLAINALGLVDIELIQVEYLLDGNPFGGLANFLANGTELVTNAVLLSMFGGLGAHTLELHVTDRSLQDQGSFITGFINFTVVPEPGTATLLMLGLAGFGVARRRA